MVKRVAQLFSILLVILSSVLMACSSTSSSSVDAALMPTAIIVRNHSGTNFASASLSALQENNQAARAFGQLAPIPNGVDQVYGRSSRAAPLPARVEFKLQTYQGQLIDREFQLDALAQDATKLTSPYALVFELRSRGEIRLLLELQ